MGYGDISNGGDREFFLKISIQILLKCWVLAPNSMALNMIQHINNNTRHFDFE